MMGENSGAKAAKEAIVPGRVALGCSNVEIVEPL